MNLYDTQAGTLGPADFTIVGVQAGPVAGSLIYDAQNLAVAFVKTGGPLVPDTYTVTFRSDASSFRDTEGHLLDGNADANEGDDYFATVVVPSSTARVLSVPDFSRGPDQPVNIPATGSGIPIKLDDGEGVLGISFVVDYDPALLTVTGLTGSSGLPENWSLEYNLGTPGHVTVLMYGATPPAAGQVSLVNLQASIPADAPYRSAGVLTLSNVEINDGAIAAEVDAGVQVVAYLGDATGNGRYGALDAAYLARVAVGRDSGFAAYPLKDPAIVGDTSGNGRVGALDASYLARKVVGRTQPEIPDLPPDLPAAVANGPDPIVRMPVITNAERGETIVQPIASDDAAGLLAFEFWIDYDTTVLDLADADVRLPAGLTGWSFDRVVNDAAGTIHVIAYTSGDPLPAGQVNLLDVTYHVRGDAPAGTSALDLEGELNEGGLVITPVDGSITVVTNQPPNDVTLVPSSVAENQPIGTVVGAFVTTDPDDTVFTYELISGDGDTDNSRFAIANGQLTTAATFNFESKSSYTIRVQATDTADQSVERTLTIHVVDVDEIPPTVTIDQAAGQADPTNAGPIHFTVVFSEPVTGFAAADLVLDGTAPGTLSAVVTPVNATTYDVAVSGMNGSGTVTATVIAGAATDAAGNASQASTSTDNAVTYDVTAPTVTINQAVGQTDPTNAGPVHFTVVFSEAVTGFAPADVLLGGTAPGTLSAVVTPMNATTYDVAVTGMTGSGTVTATVIAVAATDAAGNASQASTSTDNTVTYDVTPPTVTINQAAGQADPTNAGPIHFTVVFSEPVTGFAPADVSLGGTAPGTLSAVVTPVNGTTYDVAVTGMTGSGTVTATIPAGAAIDAAGNASQASTSTDNTVTYDVTPPTVTINQAAGQADPTNAGPIHFTVVFSEPVTGFAPADVLLGGTAPGTLSAAVTPVNATTYDVAVSWHDRQRHRDGHALRPARRWMRRGTRARRPRARTTWSPTT